MLYYIHAMYIPSSILSQSIKTSLPLFIVLHFFLIVDSSFSSFIGGENAKKYLLWVKLGRLPQGKFKKNDAPQGFVRHLWLMCSHIRIPIESL